MLPKADTRYTDFSGTAAADWRKGGIHHLAEALGIDVNRYFPIGIEIDFSEFNLKPEVSAIYAVDVQEIGENSMDAIRAHAEKNDQTLNAIKIDVFGAEEP